MSDAEPIYVRQHREFGRLTGDQKRDWFSSCADEARTDGATFFRFSVDNADAPTMGLIEGWREPPRDQGALRWQAQAG